MGENATINVGSRNGVAAGTKFIVLSRAEGSASVRAGKVRKVGEQLVQLDVKRASQSSGSAAILPGAGVGAVKEGDYVYAR
jgi:hypothetical protein